MTEETIQTPTEPTVEPTQTTSEPSVPAAQMAQPAPRDPAADYSFTGFEGADESVLARLSDFDESFVPLAKQTGLTNEQADAFRKAFISKEIAEGREILQNSEMELKKEWGADYQRNIDRINQTLQMFDPDGSFDEWGRSSGLFAHAPFVRFMNRIAQIAAEEDDLMRSVQASGLQSVKAELNAVYADPAYKNALDPRHNDVVKRALALNRKLS